MRAHALKGLAALSAAGASACLPACCSPAHPPPSPQALNPPCAHAGVFGGFCYLSSQQLMDRVNGALVVGVVASFLGLLAVAAPGIDTSALTTSHWAAVPATLPVVALSFVYHNVVPVVGASLEGDAAKVRTAIVAGKARARGPHHLRICSLLVNYWWAASLGLG